MLLFEGTSPLVQARNRESPRCQPRHGGFCSHRNPDKVSSSDRFFLKFKSQLFIDWNVAPCLIGLPTSSRVSSSPTEAWDTTSSTLDLLRWNFQFSLYPYSIFFHSRFFWNHLWEKFWENLDQGNCLVISNVEYFCLFRNIAGISDKAGAKQLASIWGKTYPDKDLQSADIREMQVLVKKLDWIKSKSFCFQALNKYKDGNAITYKTIGYLHDRAKYHNSN